MAKRRWEIGRQIPNWMIDQVVLPLIDRGYLSYAQLGIAERGQKIASLDRSQRIALIRRNLDADYEMAGGAKARSALQAYGERMRQGTAHAQDLRIGDLRTGESSQANIMAAVQRFQEDNGIHGAGRLMPATPMTPGGMRQRGGGRVGLATITALNPQIPTNDVQSVQREQAKIEKRQRLAVSADPSTAANLSAMKHWFPWMPAKTATSLAFDGFTVDDAFTQQLAKSALNDQGNPWWSKHPELQGRTQITDPKTGQLRPIDLADVAPKAYKRDPKTGAVGPILAVTPTVGSSGGGLLDVLGPVGDFVKAGSRWADAILAAPLEYVTGGLRNTIAGNLDYTHNPWDQTRFGIGINKTATTGNPQFGSGFFAQGQTAKDQAAAARYALSVDGHAWTVGRGLASAVADLPSPLDTKIIEPGNLGYNLLSGVTDLGVATYADPSNLALAGVGNARRAAKVVVANEVRSGIEGPGLINAVRRTFNPLTAKQYLASPQGQRVKQWLVNEDDFMAIFRRVKDSDTARRLKDATTEADVGNILEDVLGTTIRNRVYAPPTAIFDPLENAAGREFVGKLAHNVGAAVAHPVLSFESLGYGFRNFVDPARLMHTRPGLYIDINDPDQAVTQLDRTLHNVSTMFHQVDPNIDYMGVTMPAQEAMARAAQHGYAGMLDVAKKTMANIETELLRRGWASADAKRLTRLYDDWNRMRGWLAGEFTNHADMPWTVLNGRAQPLPSPAAYVDLLNNMIPLPNSRALKRATSWMDSRVGELLKLQGGVPQTMMDGLYNEILKPLALLRPAATLRIVGEEQVRIAADGGISFVNHPIQALALTMGAPVTGGKRGVTSRVGVLTGGLTEDSFAYTAMENAIRSGNPNDFQKAMTGGFAHVLDRVAPSRKYAGKREIARELVGTDDLDPAYVDAWAERLFHYTSDPIWRHAAGPEDTKQWLTQGDGRVYLNYMRDPTLRAPDEIPLKPEGFDLFNDADVTRFVDATTEQIKLLTGDDPQLRYLLDHKNKILDADGNEVDLFRVAGSGEKLKQGRPVSLTKEARAVLTDKAESRIGPDLVYGDHFQRGETWRSIADDAVASLFSTLYERPTNRLSRSPYFRQQYWQRVEELLPYTDAETAARIVARAEAQNMRDPKFITNVMEEIAHQVHGEAGVPLTMKSLRRQAAKAGQNVKVGYDDIDKLAKGYALDQTKSLLYDLTERSQFFDSMRLLFPFGEAFKEVTSRWLRLTAENPRVARRFYQGITAGRESGFLYTDPTSGEEVFNYPGSQAFNKLLTGVEVPITSQLNGLNIVGNGLPGVGWAVQYPAQLALSTMPKVNDSPVGEIYRNYVAPFGDVPGGDPIGIALNEALPPWLDRFRLATGDPGQQRQHLVTLAQVERYLMTTGEYGTPGKGLSDKEMQRLRKDASRATTILTTIRMVGALGLPAANNFQWQVVDKDGKLAMTAALSNELRHLIEQEKAGKIDSADQEFVKRHGLDVFASMGSITQSMSMGLPVTEKGAEWVRSHPGLRDKYPQIYGFFAPLDPKGTFDSRLYQEQVSRGERTTMDNATWLRKANDTLARYLYGLDAQKVADAFPDGGVPTEVTAALSARRRELEAQFPGFGDNFTPAGRLSSKNIIEQLRRAANDPDLRKTQQARAVRSYLKDRDQVSAAYAEQSSTGSPDGWVTSKRWAPVRVALAARQQELIDRFPQSVSVFHLLFSRDGEV